MLPAEKKERKCTQLPADFFPDVNHVICGKGEAVYSHIGNQRFRVTIAMNVEKYVSAPDRPTRSKIVTKIAHAVGFDFVRKDQVTNFWMEVRGVAARDKVSQTMRTLVKRIDPPVKHYFVHSQQLQFKKMLLDHSTRQSLPEGKTSVNSLLLAASMTRSTSVLKTVRQNIASIGARTKPDSSTSGTPIKGQNASSIEDVLDDFDHAVEIIRALHPPLLTQQSSTDWFDGDGIDASLAEFSDAQIGDFF